MSTEVYFTDPSAWRKCLSYNTYVPLSTDDILHLQSLSDLMKRHNQPYEGSKSPPQYFFGNHPIKWVRVSGRATQVQPKENVGMTVFRLVDGFGSTSLMCLQKHDNNSQPCVKADDIVTIVGHLSQFGGEMQVVGQNIWTYSSENLLAYYVFREETLEVRQHFLERSAEEFYYALDPVVIPRTSLTQLKIPEVAGLRFSLNERSEQWGVSIDDLLDQGIKL